MHNDMASDAIGLELGIGPKLPVRRNAGAKSPASGDNRIHVTISTKGAVNNATRNHRPSTRHLNSR